MSGGNKLCQLWTLDRIRDERCVEEGECWLWSGGLSGPNKTTPVMHFRGKVIQAYAATWLLSKRAVEVPKGKRLWRTCMDARCVNPKHIMCGTVAEMKTDLQKRGAYVCTLSRKAKITATIRQRHTKLKGGMAEARQIRESDDSEKVLAERHGISISHVNRIRNGHAWRETVGPASIFSMGGRP